MEKIFDSNEGVTENIKTKEIVEIVESKNKDGLATASFILGLIGGVLFLLMVVLSQFNENIAGILVFFGSLISLISLIFGIVSINTKKRKGFAITGISVGGSAILLTIIIIIIGVVVGE
jgi:hypothetical protein